MHDAIKRRKSCEAPSIAPVIRCLTGSFILLKKCVGRSLMHAQGALALAKTKSEQCKMTPLEKVRAMKMPFAELKGVAFTEAEKDRVVARMLVRPDLCTLYHMAHGGALMALADSVGAAATVVNLPEDAKGTTTIESKTNFIGAVREGATVIATATPVHRGRRTQVWQTRLETEDGRLVAVVTQTQMVL